MCYVAKFKEVEGNIFRFDTRIYLNGYNKNSTGKCIAAIVGKNPGSAKPFNLGVLEPLDIGKDRMMPYVKNRFCEAFKLRRLEVPNNSYIRVWNLFYLCNKNLDEAKNSYSQFERQIYCPTEDELPPIVWFGWGADDSFLNQFKSRFLNRAYENPFYHNFDTKQIHELIPTLSVTATHTQRVHNKELINTYLSTLL